MPGRSNRIRDAAILGAGPAGATAAALLARAGADVALIHRPWTKPPSRIEVLAPGITRQLPRFGRTADGLASLAGPCPGTVSAWDGSTPIVQDHMLSPHGPGWTVERARFDGWMREHARESGAELREARHVGMTGPSTISLDGVSLRARMLLIATGAETAKLPGRGQPDDCLIAITACQPPPATSAEDKRLILEAVPDGWWYAARGPDGRIGFGLLTDRETLVGRTVLDVWRVAARQAMEIATLGPLTVEPTNLCAAPAPCLMSRLSPSPDTIRIGNALAAYDPLTGKGVFEAVRYACDVAEHLATGNEDLALIERQLERGYAAYLEERRGLYRRAARRFDTGFWRRRVNAMLDEPKRLAGPR